MDFHQRFKGKVATMTKEGMEEIVQNSVQPINKSQSSNFYEADRTKLSKTPSQISSQQSSKVVVFCLYLFFKKM